MKVTPKRITPSPKPSKYVDFTTAADAYDVIKIFNSGYSEGGASLKRRNLRSMIPNSGSPTADILENAQIMRQRSRMLYDCAAVATSAIKTARTNVIGSGLVPKPTVNADRLGWTDRQAAEFERLVYDEFALWADDSFACDILHMNNFYEMQSLAFMSMLLSGDVFVLLDRDKRTFNHPYTLRLRLIEADRVRTPALGSYDCLTVTGTAKNGNRIYDGVEVDDKGRVIAYYIADNYPNEYDFNSRKDNQKDGPQGSFKRVRARGRLTGLPNILQLYQPERPDQYRGVPYLANVIEELLQLRRYTEGELSAAVIQSFWTAFIRTEGDPTLIPFNEVTSDDDPEGGLSHNENEYELGPATINVLRPGESIESIQPTHPQTGFDVFVGALCDQIGAALEIPSDLLLKRFGASYSASRAELLEAWKMFRASRQWFVNDFCRPIYRTWFIEAVALGRIQAPGFMDDPLIQSAYLGCEWVGPAPGQLDPIKEANAAAINLGLGLTTHEIEAARYNGSTFADNIKKLKTECALLAEATAPLAPQDISQTEGDQDDTEE